MKRLNFILSLVLFTSLIKAEGIHELAPKKSVIITGVETFDLAALNIGHPKFGDFAHLGNDDPYSQLYIHITDPNTECIYLGFSTGHDNESVRNPTLINYQFVIKDPAGNIIYGPELINPTTANIQEWEQAYNGPNINQRQDGYDPFIIKSEDLVKAGWTGKGDYTIQFIKAAGVTDPLLIDLWDITVANCVDPDNILAKKGRIWSYNWSLYSIGHFGPMTRPFNGKFYVCAVDSTDANSAFISTIDFMDSEMKGNAFSIAFNDFGTRNTGDVQYDRKSVWGENLTTPMFPIFLNDPVDVYATAEPAIADLINIIGLCDNNLCINFQGTKPGLVEILLDFHGNDGIYTPNTADVLLFYDLKKEEVNKPICIPWDGKDGNGKSAPKKDINIYISYKSTPVHFPVFDIEYMGRGFVVKRIRPAGNTPLLYYDDSDIRVESGTGIPKVNLSGCEMPCHNWTNYVRDRVIGYGNDCTINSWWYSEELIQHFLASAIIEDDESPSIACPDSEIDVYVDENCEYRVPYFLADLNPSDNCTPGEEILLSQNPEAGELMSGSITVVITAEDGAGNIATCELIINPIDTIPPQIMGAETVTVFLDKDCNYIIPDVISGRPVEDNCMLDTEVQTPEAGVVRQYDPDADAIITIDATDISGNMGKKDITLLFQYKNPFTIECPTDLTIEANTDDCGALVILGDPIISGICGSYTISNDYNIDPNAGGHYDIGTTSVTYTVTDGTGNTAECSFTVTVKDDFSFYIPNAFTPNNDGINDRITVYLSKNVAGVRQFEIYDRWGNRVHEEDYPQATKDILGWNGTYREKPLPPSIFVYKIILQLCDGSLITEHGTFSIIK